MKRRDFITLLGGATASSLWPLAAQAQQGELPVVGMLGATGEFPGRIGFSKGLEEAGFVEGRNLIIEYRRAEGHYDRLPALAADLVRRRVNVIVTLGDPASLSAKAATSTIPIVFLAAGDPVKLGLVATLNRPGGNVTGVSTFANTLIAKWLELLRELVPGVATIAFLMNPANEARASDASEIEIAAHSVRQQIILLNASTDQEIDTAITTAAQRGVGALLVNADAFFGSSRDRLVALAARYKIPASYSTRDFAISGGLMTYSDDRLEANRWVGKYAGRILKGERPADLPIMQASKFELVINLKTAKALGLTVPPTLLAAADEVIE
jgi:putative ABC transport system substrate-binding protein